MMFTDFFRGPPVIEYMYVRRDVECAAVYMYIKSNVDLKLQPRVSDSSKFAGKYTLCIIMSYCKHHSSIIMVL